MIREVDARVTAISGFLSMLQHIDTNDKRLKEKGPKRNQKRKTKKKKKNQNGRRPKNKKKHKNEKTEERK